LIHGGIVADAANLYDGSDCETGGKAGSAGDGMKYLTDGGADCWTVDGYANDVSISHDHDFCRTFNFDFKILIYPVYSMDDCIECRLYDFCDGVPIFTVSLLILK